MVQVFTRLPLLTTKNHLRTSRYYCPSQMPLESRPLFQQPLRLNKQFKHSYSACGITNHMYLSPGVRKGLKIAQII